MNIDEFIYKQQTTNFSNVTFILFCRCHWHRRRRRCRRRHQMLHDPSPGLLNDL